MGVASSGGASRPPYWRMSGFYFCYFAILGAMVPYWSPYLETLGFSAVEIGRLLAIVALTRVVAPYAGGWVADRTGACMGLVRVSCALTLLTFAGMYLGSGFWWVAAVTALYSLFWNAALPQFEVATLRHLHGAPQHYGKVRLWGSVGFVGVVAGAGWLLQHRGIALLVPILLVLMLGTLLASLLVPEVSPPDPAAHAPGAEGAWAPMRTMTGLLLAAFLMQASHGPYYAFYSLHLEALGYTRTAVGGMWALGVLAEVALFLVLSRVLPRVGAARLLRWSLGLAAVRWALLAKADAPSALIAAQLLHAATFGAFHASALALTQACYPPRLHGRGQALYSGLGFGAGGAVGGLVSGYLWEYGGASLSFGVAAGLAALGTAIAMALVRTPPGDAPGMSATAR